MDDFEQRFSNIARKNALKRLKIGLYRAHSFTTSPFGAFGLFFCEETAFWPLDPRPPQRGSASEARLEDEPLFKIGVLSVLAVAELLMSVAVVPI